MARPVISPAFGAEMNAMLRLSAPLAAANLLQMAVYAVDVVFVARLGEATLASASLAVSMFMLIMFGFSSVTSAVAPLIAAELGRRAHAVREVRRSFRMALWLSLACTAIGMTVCQFGEAFMLLTGQDPAISALAQDFLTILSFSMLPMIVANVLRTLVSTMGRPVFATVVTALSIVVNAAGNYAFVFGNLGAPALGLEGSAYSTLLTTILTCVAYAVAIRRDRTLRRYRLFGRIWRPEWQRLRDIVRIGVPIALTVMAEGGLFSSAAFLMGRLGSAELAAHTVALQVAAFFFQIPFGIGQAATIRVGYHYGAGNRDAIGLAGLSAIVLTIGFQAISAGIMLLAPVAVLSVYVDTDLPANAALVTLATGYLLIAAAFQFADGLQAVAAGALRGLQDTRVPMFVAIGGYWLIGFSIAAWLGLATPLEGTGVWIGLAAGLLVVAILLIRRWHRRGALGLLPA